MVFYNQKYEAPEVGEAKIKNKFAWSPTRIGDKIVWLSYYELIYIFAEQSLNIPDNKEIKFKQWILIDTRCKKRK